MCCLTVYKTKDDKWIITHNRDELLTRQLYASEIITEDIKNKKVWMPKDILSNGTWVASNGQLTGVILNGYKINHEKKSSYKASRGNIIPSLFHMQSAEKFIQEFDPTGYEPFTLIIHEFKDLLIEYGWDEKEIHVKILDAETPHIYSSSTLYNEDIKTRRKNHFHQFIKQEKDAYDIWRFHFEKGEDHGQFINVDYDNKISTVAISQIVIESVPVFHYHSLAHHHQRQSVILK